MFSNFLHPGVYRLEADFPAIFVAVFRTKHCYKREANYIDSCEPLFNFKES